TDFLPADLSSYVTQLASHLAAIHRVDAAELAFVQLHARHRAEAVVLPPGADATLGVARICDALAGAHPLPARTGIKLLHGDYWPGNVLWKDGRLVGVIDWEDTQSGDPIADLSVSRLDLLWAFGERAMHDFTARYQTIASIDLTDLPYWDLVTALRPVFNLAEWASGWDKFGRADVNEATMRAGHRVFVEQAFAALSA
ncbi:MAG TPA: phosphotransferase, partial [Pseudomonadales bacterium]